MQILFKGSSQSKKYPKKLEKVIIFLASPLGKKLRFYEPPPSDLIKEKFEI